MTSQALVPGLLRKHDVAVIGEMVSLLSGVVLLSVLAQMYIYLPGTPVPITGQTLGVALVALSFGRYRAVAIMVSYLGLGAMGAPVFAMGASGFLLGPTLGYLVGMLVAAFVVGSLADRGWTSSFAKSLMAAYCGSALVFGFGLLGLSFFVPSEALLAAGLYPFLIGDLIKNLIAAKLSSGLKQLA